MDSTLPAVAEELLKEIRKAFQETSHVPDDLLLGLKFIFGPSAVPALDLVDQRSVTRVVSPSGRTAYQVRDTADLLQSGHCWLMLEHAGCYGVSSSQGTHWLCLSTEGMCLSTSLVEELHVVKGGSAVPKPEMKLGGFFSGGLGSVYSDKSGFQSLQLFWEQNSSLQSLELVLGSSGKLYTCYSSCHFCTCPAFGFTVLQKSESLLCKHILAVYLSQATGACQELTVSEEQLTSILLAEEEDEG